MAAAGCELLHAYAVHEAIAGVIYHRSNFLHYYMMAAVCSLTISHESLCRLSNLYGRMLQLGAYSLAWPARHCTQDNSPAR